MTTTTNNICTLYTRPSHTIWWASFLNTQNVRLISPLSHQQRATTTSFLSQSPREPRDARAHTTKTDPYRNLNGTEGCGETHPHIANTCAEHQVRTHAQTLYTGVAIAATARAMLASCLRARARLPRIFALFEAPPLCTRSSRPETWGKRSALDLVCHSIGTRARATRIALVRAFRAFKVDLLCMPNKQHNPPLHTHTKRKAIHLRRFMRTCV